MKKIKSLRVLLLTLAMVVAMASVAFAGAQDFTLTNNTGYDIYVVNVSSSSSDSWEEDLLGSQILPYGSSISITFDNRTGDRYWDIQAVFGDGSSLYWTAIDLLSTYSVTLNSDGTATLN